MNGLPDRKFLRDFSLISLAFVVRFVLFSDGNAAYGIVPIDNTVMAGNFDAAVRVTNSQDKVGTGTLFFKTYDADPKNPADDNRYLNLSFITADHVLRSLVAGGGGPEDHDDDYPDIPDSEAMPHDYGGGYDPALPNSGPMADQLLQSIGFSGINEATKLELATTNGIVAKKVVLGQGLSNVGNMRSDIAFTAVRVDLNHPALTAAQKDLLNGLAPQTLGFVMPPPNPPGNIHAVPIPQGHPTLISIFGGYGRSGRPDPDNYAGYDFISHAGTPADEQYGIERQLNNELLRYVRNVGFYNYLAPQWELRKIQLMDPETGEMIDVILGGGLKGDSGSAVFSTASNSIIGVFTAARMDRLGTDMMGQPVGPPWGFKLGYTQIAAPITFDTRDKFLDLAEAFRVPEPSAWILFAVALLFLGYHSCKAKGSRQLPQRRRGTA